MGPDPPGGGPGGGGGGAAEAELADDAPLAESRSLRKVVTSAVNCESPALVPVEVELLDEDEADEPDDDVDDATSELRSLRSVCRLESRLSSLDEFALEPGGGPGGGGGGGADAEPLADAPLAEFRSLRNVVTSAVNCESSSLELSSLEPPDDDDDDDEDPEIDCRSELRLPRSV